MKIDWRKEWLPLGVIAFNFVLAAIVYQRVPDPMPTHWNAAGLPDDYGSRFVGVLLLPLLTVGLYLMFLVLPRIDPRQANYARFSQTYRFFRNLLIVFMTFVYAVTLVAAFQPGYKLNSAWMFVGVGFLLAAFGNYMPRVRSNWFVGIRTPWTLSSERVWRATHRLGGRVFVVGGIAIAAAGLLKPDWSAPLMIVGTLTLAIVPVVYSYVVFRQLKAESDNAAANVSSPESSDS